MMGAAFLWYSLALIVALQEQSRFSEGNFGAYAQSPSPADSKLKITCEKIAQSISSKSQVFYPRSPEFNLDISHWANSSSQVPVCTVEPATPADVASILQQIAENRVPFAVKGSGHSTNPGFSSTTGVHISMTRFNDIVIREGYQTVEVGAGLAWTDVYKYLIPKGFNVVGAGADGVGVAGLALGGGYSWKTNQYGLTVDTVTEFHLVSPNGTQMVVTEMDKDLWFALKGGFNNYGIVTKFVLKMYPQTDVWSATLTYEGDLAEPAVQAFSEFMSQPHDDHKATEFANFIYSNSSVAFGISLFYDSPEPPAGLYDELLNLPSTIAASAIFKGNFADFVSTQFFPVYNRVYFDGVPMLRYTEPIMKALTNETKFWGEKLSQYDDSVLLVHTLNTYQPDFLTHGKPSAYPPNRSLAVFPSNLYLGWTKPSADKFMADAIRRSAASLVEAGIRDGQDLENAASYVNYALFGTPLKAMYGNHLERLHEIRRKYDPDDVMRLAGGWKF